MLPWVLLYGFTALLFNHPKISIDPNTEIQNFALLKDNLPSLPVADKMAQLTAEAAQAELQNLETGQSLVLAEPANAFFTRNAFGSTEDDLASFSLIMDLNTATGYTRVRQKEPEAEQEDDATPSLTEGLNVGIELDPIQGFTESISQVVKERDFDIETFSVRAFPTLEFDAIVDGQPRRLRYSRSTTRRNTSSDEKTVSDTQQEPAYRGRLTIVGENPRSLGWRNYLLRLHMAHGYPVEKNHRWFWAIAVDLMFASMVFWGLSGVVMWWQIKRTRRIGMVLLIGSAIVATWLAIGMHWELVYG